MCDQEAFAKLRNQTEANTKQIADLAKSDAVQSVQIANLAKATENQGKNQLKLLNWLVAAVIGILLIVVLALVFGAIGERGFNGVMKSLPSAAEAVVR